MLFKSEENFQDMTKEELIEKVRELKEEIGASKFGKVEHKWFSLIENAPNIIVVIDKDHKIQFINHMIPGFNREEVLGSEIYKFISPSYHSVVESIVNHVFKTGEIGSYENEGVGPYEEHAWYEVQVGPVKSDKEIVAATLFVTDITLRKSVEEALTKSEEQYRMLVEGANQPIFKVRKDGVFLFLNQNAAEQLGGKPEDYIGKTIHDIFPKEIADRHLASIKEAISSGERLVVKESKSEIQGKTRWFEASIQPLENDEGKADSALLIVTDITSRRETDRELRREKDFTAKVINALKYPFYVVGTDYKVLLSNKAAKDRGIMEGGYCYEMSHGKSSPCEDCVCPLEKVIKEKKSVQIEHIHYGKDGKETVAEVHADPIFDDNGEVMQMIEYTIDVTKQKQAEKELRKLSYTVEQSPNVVMLTDSEGSIEYVNPRFYELTGYSEEEVLGRKPGDFGEKSEEHNRQEKEIWETVSNGKQWYGLLKNIKKNGEVFWEAAAIFPLRNEENKITNYGKIAADYTEKKRVEDELAAKNQLLHNIISNIPFFVFWKDKNSVYTGCNQNFARVAGVGSPENIMGKTDYDLAWKKEEADFFRKIDSEVMSKGEAILNIEEPQLQADGKEAILLTSKVPLKDSDGKVNGILGIYTDITDRKNMEDKLRDSEARYRTLFESSGVPMALIKNDLSILMMNDEFSKLAGHTKEDLKKEKDILKFIHKDDLSKVEEYHRLRNIDPSSVPNRYELRIVDKKGNIKEGYITVASIPDTDIMVVAFNDFTELKKSEQKLKEQKDLLDNVNRALEHKVKELEKALGHIKRLEGLVPICASCKKIKAEGKDGQEEWVQLEKYISQKTDASLTHGLCPECIKKLYGKTE